MSRSRRTTPWAKWGVFAVLATSWVLLAVRAPWTSVGGFSDATAVVAATWGWAGWVAVAAGALVPSPASLTVTRIITPLAVICAVADADVASAAAAAVALVATMSGTYCDAMVQGGAYGDETRFCLRTPVPQLAPAAFAWVLLIGTSITGSLLTADGVIVAGLPLVVAGCVLAWLVPVRLHRLSRRWLVLVPSGVVVHDHVVLGETVMAKRHGVAQVTLATGPGDAFDLTGGTAGPRLDITLRNAEKVIVSDVTARMLGISGAAHVTTFAVAPKRIGAAYSALSR